MLSKVNNTDEGVAATESLKDGVIEEKGKVFRRSPGRQTASQGSQQWPA